jgi:hypothetical protein
MRQRDVQAAEAVKEEKGARADRRRAASIRFVLRLDPALRSPRLCTLAAFPYDPLRRTFATIKED